MSVEAFLEDGGAAVLDNAVAGTTSGALRLDQEARGQSASSRVVRSGSWESIDVEVVANGTDGARAEAEVRNDAGSVTLNGASAATRPTGPRGPERDAALSLRGTTVGDGHDVNVGLLSTSRATGGNAGAPGRGGHATSESIGIAEGESDVRVRDSATGGAGLGDVGGSASSSAEGRAAGSGAVTVESTARAGSGGRGAIGGTAAARAHGVSETGRVEATATAIGAIGSDSSGVGLSGGDVTLTNAVTASTRGDVVLRQTARGGEGGRGLGIGTGGVGGDASSMLEYTHASDGNLDITVEAIGGAGGGFTSNRADSGSAFASANGESTGNVAIEATALGTNATLGTVRGVSTGGGDVSVTATAEDTGGSDVTIVDATEGQTDGGGLALRQFARGRSGANVRSELTQRAEVRVLDARVAATIEGVPDADPSETADALVDVTNTAGNVVADARAERARVVRVRQVARSTGDGNEVRVGADRDSGAYLGSELSASESIGTAEGDALVRVSDRAAAGATGEAASSAFGENRGSSSVFVSASATGGSASSGIGPAGSAQAEAFGRSTSGEVNVSVNQTGGSGQSRSRTRSDGADSHLENAASGETAGNLVLSQTATGGRGEGGGTGGNASSRLTHEHTGAGNLTLQSTANGGFGAEGGTDGEGFASVRGVGSADVDVSATAGGRGELGEVTAISTGGGRAAARGSVTTDEAIALDNLVTAESSGSVSIHQQILLNGFGFRGEPHRPIRGRRVDLRIRVDLAVPDLGCAGGTGHAHDRRPRREPRRERFGRRIRAIGSGRRCRRPTRSHRRRRLRELRRGRHGRLGVRRTRRRLRDRRVDRACTWRRSGRCSCRRPGWLRLDRVRRWLGDRDRGSPCRRRR